MSRARSPGLAAAIVLGAWALGGCGGAGDAHDAVVIRVGGTPIEASAIAHWMTVLAPEHVLPVPPHFAACVARQKAIEPGSSRAQLEGTCAQRYLAVRQKALTFLISARWLTGEAAAQGVPVSPAEVQQQLGQRRRSYASAAEFAGALRAIGQTDADVRLELEAEIAAQKLGRKVAEGEPRISPAQVAAYYRAHARDFHIPERRYFIIGENFQSSAAARGFMRELDAGKQPQSLHESLPRKPYSDYNGEKRKIYEAIFKAAPHLAAGPVRLNDLYFVVDVTRIRARYTQSLVQVGAAIERRLAAEQRKRTLAASVAGWRALWTSRTSCASGYVVQKCSQYAGPKAPEGMLSFE